MPNVRPAWISFAIVLSAAVGGCVSWLATNSAEVEASGASLGPLDCPSPYVKIVPAEPNSSSSTGTNVFEDGTQHEDRLIYARARDCIAKAQRACYLGDVGECARATAMSSTWQTSGSTADFRDMYLLE